MHAFPFVCACMRTCRMCAKLCGVGEGRDVSSSGARERIWGECVWSAFGARRCRACHECTMHPPPWIASPIAARYGSIRTKTCHARAVRTSTNNAREQVAGRLYPIDRRVVRTPPRTRCALSWLDEFIAIHGGSWALARKRTMTPYGLSPVAPRS